MKDTEVIDAAVGHLEPLLHELYVLKRMLTELGGIKTEYDAAKQGAEILRSQEGDLARQVEFAQSKLTEVQTQEVELRKQVAALTAEVEEKQRTLSSYSETIDRITGKAAAA